MASKENIPIMSALNKKGTPTADIEKKATLDTCGNDNDNSTSHTDVDATGNTTTTTMSGTKRPASDVDNTDQALSRTLLDGNLSAMRDSTKGSDNNNEIEIESTTFGTIENVHDSISHEVKPSSDAKDTNNSPKDDSLPCNDEGIEIGKVQNVNNSSTDSCYHTCSVTQDDIPAINLQRPVKRARTAYFLFVEDHRSEVQKENPGASVATVARVLGQRWSSMSDDAKQPYHDKAALERERVATATEQWKKAAKAAGMDIDGKALRDAQGSQRVESNNGQFILPIGRVRKICRLDPDVRGISKEALLLITKATEMVTVLLGQECIKTAHIQNRRTLLPQDIVDVCQVREPFYFLKDDITDLHRQQQKLKRDEKASALSNGKPSQQHHHRTNTTTTTSSKPLTDYFKPVA